MARFYDITGKRYPWKQRQLLEWIDRQGRPVRVTEFSRGVGLPLNLAGAWLSKLHVRRLITASRGFWQLSNQGRERLGFLRDNEPVTGF